MALKFYKGNILLHLVDDATHLLASTEIKSKDPTAITEAIFRLCIYVYWPAEQFLLDNGRAFANQDFLDICGATNIRVHTTAAESLFSNGFVDRHNLILSEC